MIIDDFLAKADVPETRKDLTKPENVNWLLNNLGIRNSKLPGYQEVMNDLKCLVRSNFVSRPL